MHGLNMGLVVCDQVGGAGETNAGGLFLSTFGVPLVVGHEDGVLHG